MTSIPDTVYITSFTRSKFFSYISWVSTVRWSQLSNSTVGMSWLISVCVCLYVQGFGFRQGQANLSGIQCDRPSQDEEKTESACTGKPKRWSFFFFLFPSHFIVWFLFCYVILLTHSAGDCWITPPLLSQYKSRNRNTANLSPALSADLIPSDWLSVHTASLHTVCGDPNRRELTWRAAFCGNRQSE